jgi:Zn-dependent oligopeptidase
MSLTQAQHTRVTLPILDAVSLSAACAELLRAARERFAALASLPLDQVTAATVLDTWDDIAISLEDIEGPIAILNNVHPDKSVRDAADEAIQHLAAFHVEVFQDSRLFERVRAVAPATGAEEQLRKDLIEVFEDTGASLPPDRRARAKAIAERLTAIYQEFSRNLRDNQTRLAFSDDELTGLPAPFVARLPRDETGRALMSFDAPDFTPFMANAEREEARRRYYIAYLNRGTSRNPTLLDEAMALRHELAGLHGQPSYADFVLRRRMAETPGAVWEFLADVRKGVDAAERHDLEELRQLKASRTGDAADETRLARWDVSYWSERLREQRYAVDQESLRRFFPPAATIDWLLEVSRQLFGIRFAFADVPLWHPEVRYADVLDSESGRYLGGIYFDLHPRDGKFPHAAAWPVRGCCQRTGRTPISVMVANFDRAGLTHDEVETLFHEFGHILHGVLSSTHYNQHAGTNVQRDFVEAPSQILEEWSRRLESLSLMGEVSPGTPVMDAELVARLDASRRFGKGLLYARQWLYAAFDLTLTGPAPTACLDLWEAMESQTLLGHVPDTAFPGTFAHIIGGYAAGYYGYMWAEVLALDMLSAFGANIMNPAAGHRFRREILSRGGEEPARTIAERFLGRTVNSEAFFKEIAGTRTQTPAVPVPGT